MKRFTIAIILAALIGVTIGLAAADPIMYNGGPTPDPSALSRCAGTSRSHVMLRGKPVSPLSPDPSALAASATSPDASASPSSRSTASPKGQAATNRDDWCGGQYRPDAGTNFGGS